MKFIKHVGVYGLYIKNNKILLIKKCGGPYDGKLDLPGGTIEYDESIEEALIRELKEEVGINLTKYRLFDIVSPNIEWTHKGELEKIKHFAIIYNIEDYDGEFNSNIKITEQNDDSKGASMYDVSKLNPSDLSNIAFETLEKRGVKWNI